MKKKYFVLIISLIIATFIIIGLVISNKKITFKEYKNDYYSLKYDTTWKIVDKKDLSLKHKKSKATISIKYKELSSNYIDTNLRELISDIVYSIEEQNKDYKLINYEEIDNGYSYLYESGNNQVMVDIFKKDSVVLFFYYECDSKYFDIVLDSVDAILESLHIIGGDKDLR